MAGFNIFNYFIRNADNLLIGRFLGAQALGYYTLAYLIMLYPLYIAWGILRVSFPIFAQMQDDNVRFCYAYLRVIKMISMVTFPLMFGLWGLVEPFVLTVFQDKWSPIIPLLLILVPLGLIQSIGTTVGTIYQAKGRADWMFKWGIFAGIVSVLAFIVGLGWGILGVAAAYTLTNLLILAYPNFAIPFKLIDLSMPRFLQSLWRQFICSLIMLGAILSIKFFLQGLSSAWILGILVPVGATVYLLSSWLINRQQLQELIGLIDHRQK
jgi:PST family polysaccharide transporter